MCKHPFRWQSFSASPHRLFLWGGAAYAVVSVAVWTLQQGSLYTSALEPLVWSVPYPPAHGFMMIYGVLGFYLFGFLLTTFPRWLDDAPVPRGVYGSAWVLLVAGAHGFWVGLFLSPTLVLAAVLAVLAAYGVAVSALLRTLWRTGSDRGQQVYMVAGLLLGMVGIGAMALGVATGRPEAYRAAQWLGINGFLLQVVLPVVYRMVPFFTSTVTPDYPLRRGAWALPLFSLGIALRAGLGYAGLPGWSWLGDGLLLTVLVRELLRWRFWRATHPPLLRILYLALAWFVVAFALGTGESLYLLLSGDPSAPFGNAALHALTVGGFGSLLLGISTRVSLGHSGGGLATDRLLNALFWGFQLVPLARVVPDLLGRWVPSLTGQGYWSGAGWVLVFAVWFARIGPVLMRPRSDGRPG